MLAKGLNWLAYLVATFRFKLAISLGRLAGLFSRLLGREGTSLPGWIALRLYPNLLRDLARILDKVIIITGTNGKTTTANLVAYILKERAGLNVVHNKQGANMPAGVAAALMASVSQLSNTSKERIAVLEVDEGSLGYILTQVPANLIVITNLLRDQLDRYHELEQILKYIQQTLENMPQAQLLLNADDPLVASLGRYREDVYYFGMDRTSYIRFTSGDVQEGHICPECHGLLDFAYYHYSHLGQYYCPRCGWERPLPHFRVKDLCKTRTGYTFTLVYPGGEVELFTPLLGLYNCYNILAALSAGWMLGIDPREVIELVAIFQPGQGRTEAFRLRDKKVTLVLVKNPTGLSEALRAVAEIRAEAYVLAINDLAADGRDVSWLWDVDWEPLVRGSSKRIICSGLRAWDMAVCLKYQGINLNLIKVVPNQAESLEEALQEETSEILILCTYTNLAVYRRLLLRMGAQSEVKDLSSLPRTA
ncbi:UDP-N-acetylmuramyl tripeptide synthase [Thermanaeromonas toyohensis ToBE]|uniref:Lipid II isoglutaminyl synthase (glutamine-hydrolyzing) subunit MurT n=1 Tax=Thermanaeromonas toyohensis ToBE TaxID=698762 RepID=A0A1W1VPY1_9FIRM|nr:MurT ligase domain-containing protein [Thermanaeromonas toyohensis]SMB95432.1 UDP-N-acetylmuramyl tripeptide synthase [Thermanaeromonas toyohensis ToBE]